MPGTQRWSGLPGRPTSHPGPHHHRPRQWRAATTQAPAIPDAAADRGMSTGHAGPRPRDSQQHVLPRHSTDPRHSQRTAAPTGTTAAGKTVVPNPGRARPQMVTEGLTRRTQLWSGDKGCPQVQAAPDNSRTAQDRSGDAAAPRRRIATSNAGLAHRAVPEPRPPKATRRKGNGSIRRTLDEADSRLHRGPDRSGRSLPD